MIGLSYQLRFRYFSVDSLYFSYFHRQYKKRDHKMERTIGCSMERSIDSHERRSGHYRHRDHCGGGDRREEELLQPL